MIFLLKVLDWGDGQTYVLHLNTLEPHVHLHITHIETNLLFLGEVPLEFV